MSSERTTSHAKTVEFDTSEPNGLDTQNPVKEPFNQSASEAAQDIANDHTGDGSEMVQNDQPTDDLKPPPEIAAAQDRETFNEKWSAEQQRAAENEAYLDRIEESLDANSSNDYGSGHDQGYDNSM